MKTIFGSSEYYVINKQLEENGFFLFTQFDVLLNSLTGTTQQNRINRLKLPAMTMDSNTKIAREESDNLMRTFNIFPNFRKPVNNADVRIKGIKFSPDGQKLVAANNERVIELYDCNTARFEKHFQLFKHGISTIDYMDAADKIIVGSNVRGDCTIRELNLTTNQYEASYIGHSQPSHSLSVNPASKLILSGGMDKSMLLFDFRTPNAQVARHNLSGVPLVAMHPYTDLCAVGIDDCRIEIYDLRGIPFGPFAVFKLNYDNVRWTSFKFSSNAKQLLIGTNSPKIRVVNSKTGVIQQVFGSKFFFVFNFFKEKFDHFEKIESGLLFSIRFSMEIPFFALNC